MAEKDTILSKLNIKDYRNDLEMVLDEKPFDEEAKSLLLNIFYKLDNFYKDYQSVKPNIEAKNKFLEDYINIIKFKCNEIKVLSPQEFTKETKNHINKETGQIISFPTENILLLSVFELDENPLNNSSIEFVNKCIIDMLNRGKSINNTEPIRDFNGWSWNVEINNINNIRYNIIYQNLLILFGYEFVNNIINNQNVYDEIRKELIEKIAGRKAEEFMQTLSKIAICLYNNKSKENHTECLKNKKKVQKKLADLKNRKEYINNVSAINAKYIKKIEKIDKLLSDPELIKKQFTESVLSNDGKYFCMSDVVDKYEAERKKLIANVEENKAIISPKKYLEIQDTDKKKLDLYSRISEEKAEVNVQNELVEFQKLFLEYIKIKINKDENKKDLIKIASELRYYNNIPFENCKRVTLQDEVDSKFNEITKMLINAMINEKVIDIGFKNKEFCYNILKYVFQTKIMKFESIAIKMNFKGKSQVEVEYYDGNILDHQEIFNIPFDEIITTKKSRRIKPF